MNEKNFAISLTSLSLFAIFVMKMESAHRSAAIFKTFDYMQQMIVKEMFHATSRYSLFDP